MSASIAELISNLGITHANTIRVRLGGSSIMRHATSPYFQYEPLGIVVLEAMEKPVVVSASGGVCGFSSRPGGT